MKIESGIQGLFYAMSVTTTFSLPVFFGAVNLHRRVKNNAPWTEFFWESAQPVAMQCEIHLRNAVLGHIMVVKLEHMIRSDWVMESSSI